MRFDLHLQDLVVYAPLLGQGLLTTLVLSVGVIVTGCVVGLGVALIRVYQVPVLATLMGGLVYGVRSVPQVMLLVLVHYGLLPALEVQNSFFLSAYLALSISVSAYMAEIFRGGFQALHREEQEAAISLGFSWFQRQRYILVPLVFQRMMPSLINQSVTLIKDTSLASIIGVIELTRAAEIVYERTLHEMTLLGFVAVVYFCLCYTLSKVASRLETGHGIQGTNGLSLQKA